ncbi:ATP-binding protein [Streptomyces sp. DH24]|uniref:sensor histidine kinase n=1 Tax=Streptomyces sp. DH24 TaxID=3040123 RepID=UPI0024425237|nr:ATP-binding protein [Streptomyces sp. DH24]MDG9719630.1 ATP-binding protein [Streptomyces sp. DH24]
MASKPSPAVPLAVLLVTAAAAGAVALAAPADAGPWAPATALGGWLCVAATVVVSTLLIRRARRSGARHFAEVGQFKARSAQLSADTAHLVNVTLPAVVKRLRDGTSASDTLTSVTPPSDPQLRQVVHTFASVVEEAMQHAAALDAERRQAREELNQAAAELERLTHETLPAGVAKLRDGQSADTVLTELDWPKIPLLRVPAESFVREIALSERRAAAAQAASAKALSRVQAKAVSMLADLRELQERHGEEVFGDLLRLDHSTSQLGLMTDRLALLMGGRSSRAWNRPIVMESILRGAVGRIAAYRRVRLHCPTSAAISGFAAEGLMHLLAELMDNAANFSPPIDEVHVYVEERSAGIVITIEDSGLKMADAAMRRAEQAVSGRMTDLASLQGTRLGLAVVGRLAVKYGISVNYRPSSRGGTGVVVLVPPQLLAQQRDPAPAQTPRRPAVAAPTPAAEAPAVAEPPAPRAVPDPAARPMAVERPAARVELPEQGGAHRRPRGSTPNGLPVRTPGRTMAEAEREREQRRDTDTGPAQDGAADRERAPARDAGSRFGAFHRGRRSGSGATGAAARPDTDPEPPAAP